MAATVPQLDIAKAPSHHRKLLEVITTLDAALNANPNIHFYVTGGAAAAYHLPSKQYPINDIDCICVINPTLTSEEFTRTRNSAIRTTKSIIKALLESLTPEVAADILAELPPGMVLTNTGFRISSANTNGYERPTDGTNTVTIPAGSPFTGIEYSDDAVKVRVISVRHRSPPYRTLLDITFPMADYPRMDVKWGDPFVRVPVAGLSIPVLAKEALAADQDYAAEHATAAQTGQIPLRRQRAKNLRNSVSLNRVIAALPRVKARIVSPAAAPATGGATATGFRSPPPNMSIYLESDGRIFLADHRVRRSWPARERYDPYKLDTVYSFETGFRGPIGDYWLHPDGRYRRSPPTRL